jgi:hypothetical protein
MPTVHILTGKPIHHLPPDSMGDRATGATPLTLCGRRDIPRACMGQHLEQAQEMAAESSWTVCPGCTAAYGALACSNP